VTVTKSAPNPDDDVELPGLPQNEQRHLTHEQLHRVAIASGRLRTLVLVLGLCGLGSAKPPRYGSPMSITAKRDLGPVGLLILIFER
jgi:hypothetical protein